MKRLLAIAAAVTAISLPLSARAAEPTAISLVHGIPGVTVDLVVDGTVVLADFAPGSIVDITSFAGRDLANVELRDSTSGAVLVGPVAELEIPAEKNWSIVAHLDAAGAPTLSSFKNNVDPTADGTARLTFRHTAEAPPVDLVLGDQRPVTNAANGDSSELELPVGALTGAFVALATSDPIEEITGVSLAAGSNTVVYVVGDGAAGTIGFVVQVVPLQTGPGGQTTTTVASGSVTTTSVAAAATTTTTSTSVAVPTEVGTGAPISGPGMLLVVALGGLVIALGSFLSLRRT